MGMLVGYDHCVVPPIDHFRRCLFELVYGAQQHSTNRSAQFSPLTSLPSWSLTITEEKSVLSVPSVPDASSSDMPTVSRNWTNRTATPSHSNSSDSYRPEVTVIGATRVWFNVSEHSIANDTIVADKVRSFGAIITANQTGITNTTANGILTTFSASSTYDTLTTSSPCPIISYVGNYSIAQRTVTDLCSRYQM